MPVQLPHCKSINSQFPSSHLCSTRNFTRLSPSPSFFQHDPPPLYSSTQPLIPIPSTSFLSPSLSWSPSILLVSHVASLPLPLPFFILLRCSPLLNPSLLNSLLFSPHSSTIQKKGSRKFHKQLNSLRLPQSIRPPFFSIISRKFLGYEQKEWTVLLYTS